MADGAPMPTYEYRCRDCGREFEVFQRMNDSPGAPCPDCGHSARRLISGGAGLLFKGDGFYITDHRSEAYRERAREEAGAGRDGEKGEGDGKKRAAAEASGEGRERVKSGAVAKRGGKEDDRC